jgi:class 3 adenylate cyclase
MSRTVQEEIARDAERLLQGGAPLGAYDRLADGLKQFPDDVRMRQLLALALARSGAGRLASPILEQLVREGHRDEETTGLLARTHKDLWAAATDPEERRAHLEVACRQYVDAYERSRGYWSGINAATTALLLGNTQQSAAIARAVREQCLALHQTGGSAADAYWIVATLGEAALLLESWTEAEDWYSKASIIGRGKLGDIVSTRRNARLILSCLQADAARVDSCFTVPPVVVFAGHLIDRPGRSTVRFPPASEEAASEAIRRRLKELAPAIGYSSAGCGGDILFLEALLDASAEAHIVLPYGREQFRADSVDLGSGSGGDRGYWDRWSDRYARVLDRAAEVVTTSEQRMGAGVTSFEYGFRWLDGAAAVKADELETELIALALWDGRPGDGVGGTAWAIDRWRRSGRTIEIIDLASPGPRDSVIHVDDARAPEAGGAAGLERATLEPQVVGLLFADVRGFSTLSDDEIPLFVERVLGAIADELSRATRPPLIANTWGDGLYLVFDSVRETGAFALQLCERIRSADWRAMGFTHDLALRIGLHAGPAYAFLDPVTGRPNFIGAHVSRAARIEPITPPGEVYASQAFAALARSEGVQRFTCAYVGQTPMAKAYGTFPTYVVQPRHPNRTL